MCKWKTKQPTPNSESKINHSVILYLINIYNWVVEQFDLLNGDL